MKQEKIVTIKNGIRRNYAQTLMENLAVLFYKYCEEKHHAPNVLMIPSSMLEALKEQYNPTCSMFGNQDMERFMDCEIIAVDDWDCNECDYIPRFFRRHRDLGVTR